jgi:hypothetical protein
VLLGSGEHYGWETPRPARVVALLDGPAVPGEFAWVHADAGTGHDAVEVVVRPRFGEPRWRQPEPGERIQVEAWQLGEDDLASLRPPSSAWQPPQPLPHLWLWVEG